MRFDNVKRKTGYVCIYSPTTEEAAAHLLGLIARRQPGFDEGAAAWRAALQEGLEPQRDLSELNWAGAAFTAEEWREILQRVIDGLGDPPAGEPDNR